MAILNDHGLQPPSVMGMELDVLPANHYFSYSRLFTGTQIRDISMGIRMLRSIKSDYERSLIREAAALSDQVAELVPGLIRPGITEIELAGLIEAQARRLGHQGVIRMRLWGAEMFYGHLMAGPAAAVPSFLASPTGGAGGQCGGGPRAQFPRKSRPTNRSWSTTCLPGRDI